MAIAMSLMVAPVAVLPAMATSDDDAGVWRAQTETIRGATRETWANIFAARKTWSATNGTTWAPSSTLEQDGVRLRLVGGLAGYRYSTLRYDPSTPNGAAVEYMGLRRTLDLMAGYQWSSGDWTVKVFAGLHGSMSLIRTDDQGLRSKANDFGAKIALESWVNLTSRLWASADASYTDVDRTYATRLRLGFIPLGQLSVGPELHAIGTSDTRIQRAGMFVRFDNGVHELSAAAGYDRTTAQRTAPYANVQYLYRY